MIKASRGVHAGDFAYFSHANGFAFQKWAETSPASGLSRSTVSIIGLGQPEKIRYFNGRFAKTLPAFSNLSDSRPEIVGRVQEIRQRRSLELRIG
jgi:hypothetical protein